ncbi:MAG TPA: VOC family protein [Allosphingosinicella sp.]|nr:VOC family protein [Allosphingosinicella sp.]
MAVSHIPEGYHSVTPYLIVDGAAEAIRFYAEALGASEVMRMEMPGEGGGTKIAHAEVMIGDSHVMLADEFPDMDLLGPRKRGGATASLMIYVRDVDAAFAQALAAGAKEERAPADQFWGDRMGTLVDPFGHRWTLATHVEEVPADEMQRRMAEAFKQPA